MSLATTTTVAEVMLFITWACLVAAKRKHTLFDQVFFDYSVLVDIYNGVISLSFCDGFLDTVKAAKPPGLAFFKRLPMVNGKKWGIYVLMLEKDGYLPFIYIGSGTDATNGVRNRFGQHANGVMVPKYVGKAKQAGYKITHMGLLVWCDLPAPEDVPRTRLLFIALESALSFLFGAMYKPKSNPAQDYGMSSCFYWDQNYLSYQGLCSHILLQKVAGATLT